MNELLLPENCRMALEAIEAEPLDLPPEVQAHLHACPTCAEARVQWLAQEEVPHVLAPAGYFEHLPGRILRKVPARGRRLHPLLWLAAGFLVVASSAGGFLAGRANRVPMVEASRTAIEIRDVLPEEPFNENDDVVSQLSDLSPEEANEVLNRLNKP